MYYLFALIFKKVYKEETKSWIYGFPWIIRSRQSFLKYDLCSKYTLQIPKLKLQPKVRSVKSNVVHQKTGSLNRKLKRKLISLKKDPRGPVQKFHIVFTIAIFRKNKF